MKFVFDGARAGLVVGALLTAWSFARVSSAMSEASDAAGFLYVAVAFGLLTTLQLGWGMLLGIALDLWTISLRRGPLARVGNSIRSDADTDRLATAAILAAPVLAAIVGIAVAGAHFVVTSKFMRVGFQAGGLLLIGIGGTIAALIASPLVIAATQLVAKLVPRSETRSAATTTLVALAALTVIGVVGGAAYAASLDVFDSTMLVMALGGALGTAALMAIFAKIRTKSVLWVYGIPFASVIAAGFCFIMAGSWSSSTVTMREAVTKQSALVAFEARFLQRFSDRDGDGFPAAYGGADCDDADEGIYPGAREIPGNGIDESCSGADAEPPSTVDPTRAIVSRAISAGAGAAKKTSAKLPDPPKNVIVLLVDTLRWDHLGFAGYDRDTSPNIDEIAKEGVVFSQTYATSPHTPRSIPALFLSRYPSRTLWKGGTKGAQYNFPKVLPENLSVFEVLEEKGHHNVGVSSHFYFDAKRGLQQGFASWNNDGAGSIAESNDDVASPRTWQKLEPILEEMGANQKSADARPFSLFVHLFEPHARWIKHDEFPFTGKDSRINAYDSEIAFVDSYVGKIVKKLKDEGLYENTVIALVSDHGEGFNEHGYFFHGQTLYNEIIHVPMLIRVPGWPHRTVDAPTSITDLAPTLLDLFGYPVPEEFDGTSLAPAMIGEELSERPVFAELLPYTSWKEHHKAVMLGDSKFIAIYSAGSEELYDLSADPGEKTNLAKTNKERADEMRKLLDQFTQMP